MNKKLIAMTTSLVVGGTLLLGTAFANASQLSGYETYKAAVRDTQKIKDGTIDFKMSLSDNGTALIDLNANAKINLNAKSMSTAATIKAGDKTETTNSYMQDGKAISKRGNSDEYIVMPNMHKDFEMDKKSENPEVLKSMEVVFDTLAGSMKDKVVTIDNGDGTKKVTINLNENEVTPLVNALTSVALIKGSEASAHEAMGRDNAFKPELPKLQSDVKVESVEASGTINKDDIITDQKTTIVISGKDAQGNTHKITVNAALNLSNIDNTTPDKVDLTGKNVKTMDSKMQFRGNRK